MLFLLLGIVGMLLIWKVLTRKTSPLPPEFPGRWPIVGHVHMLLCSTEGKCHKVDRIGPNAFHYIYRILYSRIQEGSKKITEMGGSVSLYLGPLVVFALTDPEDILTVCNNCFEKDHIYNNMKPLLGEGLVTGSAKVWKRHRKLINPAFNQQVLNSFIGIFNSQAKRLVEQLSSEVGKPVDQEYWLRLNNLETICLTSAGGNFEEYKDFQEKYLSGMPEFLSIATSRLQNVLLHLEFFFNMTKMKMKQDKIIQDMQMLSTLLIKNKKMKSQNVTGVERKCVTFMDLMIELANETGCFTDEEIREQTDNIIAGGHETTSIALTFVFALLGSYPEVQQKVYNEVISMIGKSDTDIDKDDIPKLVYMEAVLKETLRLYPVAPVIMRHNDKEVKLKNYTIKPNSRLAVSVCGMNRHPVWGPDADEFKPERWLDQKTLPDKNYFGSFGLGRRSCIGKMYAMMSMKISMAHLLRRYKLHSNISNLRLKFEFMLRVVSGHEVTFELRE